MGKPQNEIVRRASEHVFNLFREPAESGATAFRGFKHSRDVVSASKEIAKGANLDADATRIVLLAAWFVDAAYAVAPDGQRRNGGDLARDFLIRNGQPEPLIDDVVRCIDGAVSPSRDEPLHEVLHDAVLSPLADKSFMRRAELYRLEQERQTGRRFTDVEWTERCIAFVESHPYRTRHAQLEFAHGREANLIRLHKRLRKLQQETALEKPTEGKRAKGAVKTVENVFYFLTKMTVQLMVLADRRTATMIHVNALMISAVVTLLVRKLDTQRYLIAPTLVLLAVNLLVIVIAVLSMRHGRLASAEAASHGRGSPIFALDAEVSLEQYQTAMDALAADAGTLQKTMVEQLYVGRKILNQRTRGLRLTYDAFIYGLAVSLAVFGFVLIRR